jgi:hypothetical protein
VLTGSNHSSLLLWLVAPRSSLAIAELVKSKA